MRAASAFTCSVALETAGDGAGLHHRGLMNILNTLETTSDEAETSPVDFISSMLVIAAVCAKIGKNPAQGCQVKVFLSGGTGFIGGHVRKALLDNRHQVILLTHRGSDGLEPGVQPVEGDVTSPESFVHQLRDCDAIINLVGIIREAPARAITFERLHVLATKNLVDGAKTAGVPRFLQMSALGARPNATSTYHQTKFRAEEYLRASGLYHTIFRPSIVFGPRDAFVNMLAGLIRNLPAVPVIGDGKYRLQPVAVDDVARCFVMALEMPQTIGQTYELCGDGRYSYNEMLDVIGRVLGKQRVMKIHHPLGLMKLIVPLLQNIPAFPITTDQLLMLVEENICDGGWRKTFRFEPQRFEDGIRSYLKP